MVLWRRHAVFMQIANGRMIAKLHPSKCFIMSLTFMRAVPEKLFVPVLGSENETTIITYIHEPVNIAPPLLSHADIQSAYCSETYV
jgi:hypothetical protein